MIGRWGALLLVLCAGSCAKESQKSPIAADKTEPAEPEITTSRAVVVRKRAWLYAAPADTAYRFALPERAGFRLIGETGDWLEIETFATEMPAALFAPDAGAGEAEEEVADEVEDEPAEFRCSGSPLGLTSMRIRMHVRRSDLSTVVTRAYEKTFDDGTGFEVWPGLPVDRAEGGTPPVYRSGEFSLPLPAEMLGTIYDMTKGRPFRGAGSDQYLRADSEVAYGPHSAKIPMRSMGLSPAVEAYRTTDTAAFVTLATQCREVVARTSLESMTDSDRAAHVNMRWPQSLEGDSLTIGAKVYFADGTPAGVTTMPGLAGVPAESHGLLRCYARGLEGLNVQPSERVGRVQLCFHKRGIRPGSE